MAQYLERLKWIVISFFGAVFLLYFFGIDVFYGFFISMIIFYILMYNSLYDKEEKIVKQPESNECSGCGKKNREGVRFCRECGRSL
jgi:hypothetical protein